jgi:hypothetical protein
MSKGFLNYEVGGMHYLPGGEELATGTYDLLMKSSVARCFYNLGTIPISAKVTVVNDKGRKEFATTTVSEKKGWLKLSAKGFTFSKKTIRAKITKAKATTITCVATADAAKSKKVKAINPKCPKGFAPKVG